MVKYNITYTTKSGRRKKAGGAIPLRYVNRKAAEMDIKRFEGKNARIIKFKE